MIELYKVKQAGKGDPLAYQRREVEWWPRKGVDIIAVKKGMPLRTWTLRTVHQHAVDIDIAVQAEPVAPALLNGTKKTVRCAMEE
ncbi:MAG: hypothetical protein QF473_40630 [Planctomycetota bacterium]|nr:hypothetical protein [Planctomycetota bacterium]MDP6361487.1 hypothetical protein [Planctomycetota bacterium]